MADTLRNSGADELYEQAAAAYGAALERLARGYEADSDLRRDLLQDIHLALWRSFTHFAHRCSLRTWVYRVAHNTAASHVLRQRRKYACLVGLEDVEGIAAQDQSPIALDRRAALDRLLQLIYVLKPPDRQVILSYLEGMDVAEIAELTGMSPANVMTKVHRIKSILTQRFQKGAGHAR